MADTPYPFERQTRQSAILVGNGTAGPYGPSAYRVFDLADVQVFVRHEGEAVFAETLDLVLAKTTGAGFDTFSVTFDEALPASAQWYHQAARTHERSVAVTRAGAIAADQLEKELSKQGTVLAEARRDLDRSLRIAPGTPDPGPLTPETGKVIGWHEDGTPRNFDNTAAAAQLSAERAEAARDRAADWAEKPEDVPVLPGQFSAKHHAIKAAGAAGVAEGLLAETSELRDETADLRDQAALSATAAATEVFNRFESTAAGIAATANGDTFWVIGTAGGVEVLHLWKNNAGVAQDMGLALPSYLAYALLSALIQPLSSPHTIAAFADMFRFVIGRLKADGSISTLLFSIEPTSDGGIKFKDRYGFVPIRVGPNGTHIAGLTNTTAAKLPSDAEPWIGPRIFGWAGEMQEIYTELLFPTLGDADLCTATIIGSGTTAGGTVGVYPGGSSESGTCLTFDPGALGASAEVVGRPRAYDGGDLKTRTVAIFAVPATVPPVEQRSPVIFTLGESNSQFVMQFCGPKLFAKNFTPIAPGTLTYGGYGSEGRSGWESGHITGAVTTGPNVSMITDWPAYLGYANDASRIPFTPFHRLPTEDDPPEIVINNRVLDFAWYQAHTGIPTPTDVAINFGTNDLVRLALDEVYSTIYANTLHIYGRLHAAWPAACIHHWHPIFPRSVDSDRLRPNFREMIRALMDAVRVYNSPRAWLVPTWLSAPTVACFDLAPGTTNPTTGVRSAGIIDWKHPRGGARVEMFRVLASSFAARARGLIGV